MHFNKYPIGKPKAQIAAEFIMNRIPTCKGKIRNILLISNHSEHFRTIPKHFPNPFPNFDKPYYFEFYPS